MKKLNVIYGLIEMVIKFQIALINNATSILYKNGVKNEQKFRYSIVSWNLTLYFNYPGNTESFWIVISETYKRLKEKNIE